MSVASESRVTLEELVVPTFHRVVRATDPSRGLDAIIAIHSLTLCRAALGGTRMRPYASFEEALTDVTRLAEGMTYKSAASMGGWGGAKSVIIGESTKKTPELFAAFAEAVNAFEGSYVCAEDLGTTTADLALIAEHTPYAVGLPSAKSSGDPSHYTAWGVFRGIQAILNEGWGTDSLQGITVAIQGLGNVGGRLAELLFWHGARLVVTDVDRARAERFAAKYGAKVVEPDAIYDEACDIFSPCALGGTINPKTIKRLRCKGIAGAANNQLLTEADGEELHRLGMLYAPDFLINAGGFINVTFETFKEGYQPVSARKKVDEIYDQLKLVFEMASQNGVSTYRAVMDLVKYRLAHQIGRRDGLIYMHSAQMSY